ncbi:MAG: hypothetical protein R3248_01835 [Candidatus Promineifilaceae bacterium]|nr:hypothetical protein [Candidatus Promineifilaceae bacterium]
MSADSLTYLALMALLFLAKAIELLAGVTYNVAGQQAPVAGLVLYALLGVAGLWLAGRTGFPDMWDQEITNRNRFLLPAAAGVVTALGMVAMDLWLRVGAYPQIPQTELPEGLLLVIIAGITEEVALRLFLIPLLVWLVSGLLLKGRWQERIFWGAAGVAAVLYSLLAVGALLGRAEVAGVSSALPFYVLGLPTILLYSLLAAYFFRRSGFLAVLSLRFGFYFVWHILWALG